MSDKPEAPEGWQAVEICRAEVNPFDWMRCHGDRWYKLVPKRWRAKRGGRFFFVKLGTPAVVGTTIDERSNLYYSYYKYGNYFRTEQEAKEYADKINALFKERTQ